MGKLSGDALRWPTVEWTGTPCRPEGLGIALEDCLAGPQLGSERKGPEKTGCNQSNYATMPPDPVLRNSLASRAPTYAGGPGLYLLLEAKTARRGNLNATLFFREIAERATAPSAQSALAPGIACAQLSTRPFFFADKKLGK